MATEPGPHFLFAQQDPAPPPSLGAVVIDHDPATGVTLYKVSKAPPVTNAPAP